MCRVAVMFGIVAAVAFANPAGAAVFFPHDFFHEPAPSPPVFDSHDGFSPTNDSLGGGIRPFEAPIPASFDAGDDQNGFGPGWTGIPLFDIRFDPGHDFYNSLKIAPPAVPEPETWTMLLFGFAAVGFVARRAVRALPVASAS